MLKKTKTVLIADDDKSIRLVLERALSDEGYHTKVTDNAATLWQWVEQGEGDLVITDVRMPGQSGLDLLPKIKVLRPELEVVVISAQNTFMTAVLAAERGALEYLPKPFDLDELLSVVGKSFQRYQTLVSDQDNNIVDDEAVCNLRYPVVGRSQAMQDIYRTIARLMHSDLTVLITGESGTGKEVIARALHNYSSLSKEGVFVAVNMAAIPKELIESELFGHEKGAFTGADHKTIGRFEEANGGTLFLDEIGDMPYETQTRLLRVLQEGEYYRVGGQHAKKIKVRILAATHQDLPALIKSGKFRDDLYYRLNVIPLCLPALRERCEDVEVFVQHFLQKKSKSGVAFTPQAIAVMEGYSWPGNIRELENFVYRLVALNASNMVFDDKMVSQALYPQSQDEWSKVTSQSKQAKTGGISTLVEKQLNEYFAVYGDDLPPIGLYDRILPEVEKPLIQRTLKATSGNQIKAAEVLGINRNTLRKKISLLKINVKECK